MPTRGCLDRSVQYAIAVSYRPPSFDGGLRSRRQCHTLDSSAVASIIFVSHADCASVVLGRLVLPGGSLQPNPMHKAESFIGPPAPLYRIPTRIAASRAVQGFSIPGHAGSRAIPPVSSNVRMYGASGRVHSSLISPPGCVRSRSNF